MNSSQIVLQAVLDSSGIGKSDIDKIQKRLDKYPLHLTADLNKKELLKAVKKVVPELEKELKNVTGIDIAINDKAIKRAISQVIKDERRLQAELDRTIKKAEKAQKKFEKTGAIQFSINDSAYSAQIAKLKAQLEQYNVSVYEAEKRTKDLSSTLSSIDTSSSKGLASEFSDLEKQIKAVDEQAEQAQGSLGNLNNIITTLSHKNALKNQISDFKQLTSAAKDLSPEIDNVCDSLENCSDVDFSDVLDGLSDISNQIAGTGQSSNSFGGFLQDAVDTLLEFPSASSIIPSSEDIIRDMVSSIYDIDTAMTSLHMVTDETSTKYDQFLNGATSKAQELGRSVSSLVEQTTNWVKLGFSLDDSAKLGEYSSIYSNISGIDDDTAINNMLTAMKAFNIEATDSIQIIDKLSVLGSQYAVSSTDLGAALSESASTLASTGNSIDETLAMITAMSEVTHSASESGDALNSLAMQLRGYDEETGAYSKNIAELTTSIAQLTATASTPSGISIFTDDTESTYKSTYQIMKDISAVWDSMSNKNQVKLLDVLGGSQNGDNVSALLGNMSQAQNALQSSIYSTGSAYAKQEEWLQSLEGKVQQFQTAFQGLSQAVMDSDFLKGLVDTGTGLINVLDTIIDKFGLFPTLLAGATLLQSGKGLFNFDSIKDFSNALSPNISSIRDITKATKNLSLEQTKAVLKTKELSDAQKRKILSNNKYTASEIEVILSTKAFTFSLAGATTAIKSYAVAMWESVKAAAASAITNPFLWISGIVSVLSFVVNRLKEIRESNSLEGIRETLKEQEESYKQSQSEVESLESQLADLKKSIDEINSLGGISVAKDGELEKLQQQTTELEAQLVIAKEKARLDGTEVEKTAVKALNKTIESKYSSHFEQVGNPTNSYPGGVNGYMKRDEVLRQDDLVFAMDDYNQKAKEKLDLDSKIAELDKERNQITDKNSDSYKNLSKEIKELNNKSTELANGMSKSEQYASELYESISADASSIHGFTPEGVVEKKEFEDSTLLYYNWIKQKTVAIFTNEDLTSSEEDLAAAIAKANEESRATTFENVDKTISTINKLDAAKTKLKDNKLSEQDVYDLIRDYKELAPYVDMNAKNFGNLAKGLDDISNKNIASTVDDLKKMLEFDVDGNIIDSADNRQILAMVDIVRLLGTSSNETSPEVYTLSDAISSLTNSHDLLKDLKKELDEFGTISVESISKILQKYPEMESYLMDYQAGILSTADIYNVLSDNYNADLIAYKNYLLTKNQYDQDFYTSVGLRDVNKINQFNSDYGVDLGNCKNYASAKLQIEQSLLKNVSKMWAFYYNNQIDTFSENLAALGMTLGRMDPNSAAYQEVLKQYLAIENYQKAMDALNSIAYEGLNTDFNGGGSGNGNTTTPSLKEFNQELDWSEKAISRLQKKLAKLQAQLEYSTAYETQIKLIKKLIDEQSKLVDGYAKQQETYKAYYDDTLKNKSLTKADKNNIKNGTYNIQTFKASTEGNKISKNEKEYNAIIAALEAQEQYNQSLTDAFNAKQQLKEYAEQLASVPWAEAEKSVEKLNTELDLLDAKLNNASGYIEKNDLLEKQLKTQSKIVGKYQKAIYQGDKLSKDAKNNLLKALETDDSKAAKALKVDGKTKVSIKGLTGDTLKCAIEYNATIEALKNNTRQLNIETENYKTLIADIAKQELENISATYDNRRMLNDRRIEKIQAAMALAEAKGKGLSKSYYDAEIDSQKDNIESLKEEKDNLVSHLNQKVKLGEVKYQDDTWYEMMSDIIAVDKALDDTNLTLAELQNSITELEWNNFDEFLNRIQAVIDESDFLIELLSTKKLINDETGTYTNEGLATQGQHAVNYDLYMKKANEAKDDLTKLDATNADNKNDTKYLERRAELLQMQQDSILAAEKEKQSMIDLAKEGISTQISAMEDLIAKKKEAIDLEEELYERQKTITQKTKSVADIQKQINALQGDDSLENRKKLQQLKAALKDAETDLEETESKYSRDDQKKALDEELKKYKEYMEDYCEDTENLFQDTMNTVNSSSSTIASTLETTAKKVGYQISEHVTDAWKDAGDSVKTYSSTFSTSSVGIIGVIDSIRQAWNDAKASYDSYAETALEKDKTKYEEKTTSQKMHEVLGKSSTTNGESNKGTSALNKYAASLGYSQLSYADMVNLAGALGVKDVKSVADVSTSENAKANRTAIKNAMQKQLITDLLNNGTGTTFDSDLNKYIVDKGYKALSYNQMVTLGKLLEVEGSTLENVKDGSATKNKIKDALEKAKFSKGGMPELIRGTGEDGIALVKRGEPILTQKEGVLFSKFVSNLPKLDTIMDALSSSTSYPHLSSKNDNNNITFQTSINVDGVATDEIVYKLSSMVRKETEQALSQINTIGANKGIKRIS